MEATHYGPDHPWRLSIAEFMSAAESPEGRASTDSADLTARVSFAAAVLQSLQEQLDRIQHLAEAAEELLPDNTDRDRPSVVIEALRRVAVDGSNMIFNALPRLGDTSTDPANG